MENVIRRKPVSTAKKIDQLTENGQQPYTDRVLPPLPTEVVVDIPIAKLADDSDGPVNNNDILLGSASNTYISSSPNQATYKGHSSRILPKLNAAGKDLQSQVLQDDSDMGSGYAPTPVDRNKLGEARMTNVAITDDDDDAMLIAATYLMEEGGQDHFGVLAKSSKDTSEHNDKQGERDGLKASHGKGSDSNDIAPVLRGASAASLQVPTDIGSPVSQYDSFSPKQASVIPRIGGAGSGSGGKENQSVVTQIQKLEAKEAKQKAEEEATMAEKKENFVRFKINELRNKTGTQCHYRKYGNGNMMSEEFPVQHLGHNREWYDKLLRCNECTDPCARCGVICCAYKQAIKDAADPGKTGAEKLAAKQLYDSIDLWVPVGDEGSAFMLCDECTRRICPKCAGVCPVFLCFSRSCKDCEPNVWKGCVMHTDKTKAKMLELCKKELKEYYGMIPNSFRGFEPVCERYRKMGE